MQEGVISIVRPASSGSVCLLGIDRFVVPFDTSSFYTSSPATGGHHWEGRKRGLFFSCEICIAKDKAAIKKCQVYGYRWLDDRDCRSGCY